MKIALDSWGGCLSNDCRYKQSCAQHYTAGQYRSEDGFQPTLVWKEGCWWDCKTAGQPEMFAQSPSYPDNTSERGMLGSRELQVLKQMDYCI